MSSYDFDTKLMNDTNRHLKELDIIDIVTEIKNLMQLEEKELIDLYNEGVITIDEYNTYIAYGTV